MGRFSRFLVQSTAVQMCFESKTALGKVKKDSLEKYKFRLVIRNGICLKNVALPFETEGQLIFQVRFLLNKHEWAGWVVVAIDRKDSAVVLVEPLVRHPLSRGVGHSVVRTVGERMGVLSVSGRWFGQIAN